MGYFRPTVSGWEGDRRQPLAAPRLSRPLFPTTPRRPPLPDGGTRARLFEHWAGRLCSPLSLAVGGGAARG